MKIFVSFLREEHIFCTRNWSLPFDLKMKWNTLLISNNKEERLRRRNKGTLQLLRIKRFLLYFTNRIFPEQIGEKNYNADFPFEDVEVFFLDVESGRMLMVVSSYPRNLSPRLFWTILHFINGPAKILLVHIIYNKCGHLNVPLSSIQIALR